MIKRFSLFGVMLILPLLLWAQSDLLDSDLGLDDLLGNSEETGDAGGADDEAIAQGGDSVIEDLIDEKSLDLRLASNLSLGYSPGWDRADPLPSGFNGSPVFEWTSTLTLDFIASRQFRGYQKWKVEAPGFVPDLSEAFVDYHPADILSVRAGRFSETWGESRNFSHTNLIARIPDEFTGTDTLAVRALTPWKTGFIEALALTREGYWEDKAHPGADEFGWGLRINPPLPNMDLTAAVFAHPRLNLRGTVSLKTTLFDSLETYGEFLTSVDKDLIYGHDTSNNYSSDGKADNPLDYSLNLGLYHDFLDNRLSLGGEYFFNGEESEMNLASETWDLFYGHNLVLYTRWKQNDWDLSLYGRYSEYYRSGIIGSGFNWSFADGAKLQLGGAWAWGDSAYAASNPDDWNRDALLFMRVVINGSWETVL